MKKKIGGHGITGEKKKRPTLEVCVCTLNWINEVDDKDENMPQCINQR